MLNEEDLEMGIPHSLIEDENGDTTLASDANSYGQNIAGANDADTYSSPTTLLDSERIHDVVDSASSTANVGQLPSDADVAVHDNHEARKFRVQDFIAGLLDANQSGEVDLGQVESIMMRVAVASNSAGASNRERGEDAARAPSSVVSTIQDGSESADADAEVSPLFADEHSTVSTHLSGLDGLTRDNIPPMTVEDEATSPWTLENAGTVPFSSVAEFEGVPQIQEEYYDVESPSSYHCDAADGNNLNSPFGESSPLFADDPATRNMTAASPFSGLFTGLDEADHEDVAPLPPGVMIQSIIDSQIEDGKMRGGLAQSDDHNDGPPGPSDVENEFGGSSATRKMRGEVPEQVRDEDNGPDPFGTSATFEDANIIEKVRGQATSNEHGLNDDAQLNPPLDVVETGSQLHSDNDTLAITGNENEVPPQTNTADLGVSSPVDANQSNNGGTDTVGMGVTSSDIDTPSGDGNEVSNMAPARDVDQDGSILRIPEAYLVEPPDGDDRDNGEVVIATQLDPPVPFYKQKRVVCFLSVLMLIVIAIATGVTSSLNGTPETVTELIAPPISIVPTTSSSPSSSPAPSYSPSSCVDTVSNGKQTLDMPLDSPDNIQVAIDGRNMAVIAKDVNLPYMYVVFYSLEDDKWVRKIKYFIEDYEHSNEYSVALSGSTALVGLGFAGTDAGERAGLVYAYRQDDKGVWNELQEPILPEDGGDENAYFGGSVDIDGNLVCVTTPHHAYVFRMNEDQQWAQIHRLDLDSDSCSVVGNTIAVRGYSDRWQINIYQFDDVTSVLALQNKISAETHYLPLSATSYLGAIALSANHLVYSTESFYKSSGIFIYQRQDTNHPFVLHQSVTSSEFSGNIGYALALDEDILVIVESSGTHVLSEQNGVFEKSLSLNQHYQSVQISGRSLIATTDEEVHAFAIDDCTQAVPTQTPSASSSPTTLPSSPPSTSTSPSELPSMSPSPSVRPSTSSSPTETCYWIDVSVDFDCYPTHTSWDVERINDFGDNIVVKTYNGISDDWFMLRKESMCLEEGQYQFTINDRFFFGNYSVKSYGELIVEGGKFGSSEATSFSLPLSTATSAMP